MTGQQYPSFDTNHMTVSEILTELQKIKSTPGPARMGLDERALRFSLNRRGVIQGLSVPMLGEK